MKFDTDFKYLKKEVREMDWERWVKGKTQKEIEEKLEELGRDLKSPEGIAAYEMILDYSKKFRPDLLEELISLEREVRAIQDSTVLTDEEKELKAKDVFLRMSLVLGHVTRDAEMRTKPAS